MRNNIELEYSSIDGENTKERVYNTALATTSNITIEDSTAMSKLISGGNNFTIGEPITFWLKLNVNEGTTERIVVKDELPAGMAFNSAVIEKENENITYVLNSEPSAGETGEIVWDLSAILNPNNADDTDDIIIVKYTAIIQDVVANVRGLWLENTAHLEYIDGEGGNQTTLDTTSSVVIIEPELKVESSITTTGPYEAGNTVTYQVIISHTADSNATAYDVELTDMLPDELTYVSCTVNHPVGDPVQEGQNTIWGRTGNIDINVGTIYEFTINATLDKEVKPGQELNNNIVLNYSSLDGDILTERDYNITLNDTDDIIIKDLTALTKDVVGSNNYGVGELITYRLNLYITEGTTDDVVIKDTLPAGLVFESATISKGNENISYTLTNEPIEGATGELTWELGSIINPGNGDDTDDKITVDYTAFIQDIAGNVRGKVLTNTAHLEYVDGDGVNQTTGDNTATVTVIEPELKVEASILSADPYEAGDDVIYQITISHTGASDATAYDVKITDTLPDELSYSSYIADPNDPAEPVISGQNIIWGGTGTIDIDAGDTFVFNIYVTLDDEVKPDQVLSNNISINYSSTDGDNVNQREYNTALVDSADITVIDTTAFTKEVTAGTVYAIGEPITFNLNLTLNEGTTNGVVMTDTLPAAIEFVSATIVKGNENISYLLNNEPVAGATGEIQWDFGAVVNPGNSNDTDDTITVEYTAIILNEVGNVRGNVLTNIADLEYIDGNGDTQTIADQNVTVTVIEPELQVEIAIISAGPYEAGDDVTYQITISHTGESDGTAFNVEITDILPDELTYVSYTPNPNDPGAPVIDGQNIIWGGTGDIDINVGETVIFNINVTLDNEVKPEQILGNNIKIDYSSTDGDNVNQREYSTTIVDAGDVIVNNSTSLTKEVVGGNNHAVGESITYKLNLSITEGTTDGVVITDTLPAGMEFVSATVVKGNENITYVLNNEPVAGATGEIQWNYGTVVNLGNSNDVDDKITVEYTAIILNEVGNARGTVLTNIADLEYIDGKGVTQTIADQNVTLTVIEPELQVETAIISAGPYEAGDTVIYQVTITHTDDSDATAFDVEITDILPDELTYVSYTPNPNDPGAPVIDGQNIIWGGTGDIDINVGETVIFNINVTLDDEVKPEQMLGNNIKVDYSSTDGDNANQREYSTNVVNAGDVTVNDTTAFTKEVTASNDYAIGEPITYKLNLSITEGTTNGVVMTDTLPAGIEFVSATIVKGNENISYLLNNEPVAGATGEIQWDFGAVVNPGNSNDTDDTITVEYTAIILNEVGNVRGNVLTNIVDLEYIDGNGDTQTIADQNVAVTVIEPELQVETAIITAGPYEAGDIVTYQVTITHTDDSDATAFDVEITDMLPDELTYVSYTPNPNDPGAPVIAGQNIIWGGTGNIDIDTGDTFVFNINVTLDDEVKPEQILGNNIKVDYSSTDGDNANQREYSTNVVDAGEITVDNSTSLTKEVVGGNNHAVGELITFKLNLHITEGTTEGVVIRDTLPANMVFENANIVKGNENVSYNLTIEPEAKATGELTWDFGTIVNPGNGDISDDTIIVEYTAVIQNVEGNVRGTVLTNTASLEYTDGDGNSQNPDAENVEVTVVEPELKMTKTCSDFVEINQPAIFTIAIENIGDSTAWQTKLVDTLPEEMRDTEPVITSIQVGEPVRILSENDSDDYDAEYNVETGEWTITLKSANARIEASETLTIVYEASLNNETFDVDTITNKVNIKEYHSTDISGGISDETRTYIPEEDDENQNTTADITIHTPVIIAVTVVNKDVAKPDEIIHYKVTITNNGNIDATELIFVDEMAAEFAAGTLTNLTTESGVTDVDSTGGENGTGIVRITEITILNSGGTVTIEWDITLKPVLPSGSIIQNQAELIVPEYSEIVLIDFDDVTVESAPILSFEMSDQDVNGSELDSGDIIRYILKVKNIGNENAVNVTVKDLIPSNTAYVDGSTTFNGNSIDDLEGQSPLVTGMAINASEGLEGWLNVGEESTIEFMVEIRDDVSPGTNILNQATLMVEGECSGPISPIFSDDPDTEVIGDATVSVVGNWPIIDVQKIVTDDNGGILEPGDLLTYIITITNSGTAEATGVVYNDDIPEETVFVPGTISVECVDSEGVITIPDMNFDDYDETIEKISCDVGTVEESTKVVITFKVRVVGDAEGVIIFSQGVVSSNELPDELTDADGIDVNGDQPTEVAVGTNPVLRAFMHVSDINGGSVVVGDVLEYTILMSNIGSADATNVTVTNPLPVNLEYIVNTTSVNGIIQADQPDDSSVIETGINLGTISQGDMTEVKYRVTVSAGVGVGTVIDNQANFEADGDITGLSDSDLDDGVELGNNQANANDDDPTRVQVGGNPGTANISGTVWLDENCNMNYDVNELYEQGWIVDVFQKDNLIDRAITDINGSFEFNGITPGNDYRISFRNSVTDVVWKSIEGLTLLSGTITNNQDLPIQPTGVVYDAITREPVEGVVVTIAGPEGFDPELHLLSGQQNQTTIADGKYRFDVMMSHGAPEGIYTISMTPPMTYSPAFPATIITPEIGNLDPTGGANPYLVVADSTVPQGDETTYYLTFDLANGDPDVVNNHIPIDPILEDAIFLTKTTSKELVKIGDFVPYTVTVQNQTAALITPFRIEDKIPTGFKYVAGSAKVDGVDVEPDVESLLAWDNLTVQPNESMTITYKLVVGTGVVEGETYRNTVIASHELTDTNISNEAEVEVQLVGESNFSKSAIIGKVFNDINENGVQDEGEEGIAGVQIVTVSGNVVTTDSLGRYHVGEIEVKGFTRGMSFILKVDTSTLPSGSVITTENPSLIKITQGLVQKINFGVKVPTEE